MIYFKNMDCIVSYQLRYKINLSMKTRVLPLFLALFLSFRLFPQDLKITAVYYNSDSIPYKIEQKYVDKDSSLLYVGHYNDGSNCISVKNTKRGDTAIISEGYYLFGEEKTPLENYIQKVSGISFTEIENNPGTFISNAGYDSSAVVDSIMPLAEVKKYVESCDMYNLSNKLHMTLLLEGKIKMDPDKRILQETVNTFYVNNRLVKIEWRGKENQLIALYKCTIKDCSMACEGFGFAMKLITELSIYNTISWNKDSSRINWVMKDKILKANFHTRYCLDGKNLKVYSGNKMLSETDYLELNDPFKLFIKNGLEDDSFCSNQLLGLEKCKPVKEIYQDGHIRAYTYIFDAANRITGQKQYYDGKPDVWITYNYYLMIH